VFAKVYAVECVVKAKFHYAIQVADLVCDLVADLLARASL